MIIRFILLQISTTANTCICRKNKASGVRLKPLQKEKPKSKRKISTKKKRSVGAISPIVHYHSDGYRSDFEDDTSQDESAVEIQTRKLGDDIVSEKETIEEQAG